MKAQVEKMHPSLDQPFLNKGRLLNFYNPKDLGLWVLSFFPQGDLGLIDPRTKKDLAEIGSSFKSMSKDFKRMTDEIYISAGELYIYTCFLLVEFHQDIIGEARYVLGLQKKSPMDIHEQNKD